jgi:hypothetical protein
MFPFNESLRDQTPQVSAPDPRSLIRVLLLHFRLQDYARLLPDLSLCLRAARVDDAELADYSTTCTSPDIGIVSLIYALRRPQCEIALVGNEGTSVLHLYGWRKLTDQHRSAKCRGSLSLES